MRRFILILALVFGIICALGAGFLVSMLGLLVIVAPEAVAGAGSRVAVGGLALAIVVAGGGLGVLLAVNAGRSLVGRPTGMFVPGSPLGWGILFVMALLIGQLVAVRSFPMMLAPVHAIAAVAPPLALIALSIRSARRAGGWVTSRRGAGSLAWGGLGAVALSIVLEVILVAAIAVVAMLAISVLRPALVAQLQELALELQAGGQLGNIPDLATLARSPAVILVSLAVVGVLIPLLEELMKSLAVPLVHLTGQRLRPIDGFLLGATAGAGFALVEGMLNGVMALQATETWGLAMAARGGAAAMHCVASGLAGLAWQQVLTERRLARGNGLFAVAVFAHGLWNSVAIGISLLGLGAQRSLAGPLQVFGVLLMAALFTGAIAMLAWLPGRLARAGTNAIAGASGSEHALPSAEAQEASGTIS